MRLAKSPDWMPLENLAAAWVPVAMKFLIYSSQRLANNKWQLTLTGKLQFRHEFRYLSFHFPFWILDKDNLFLPSCWKRRARVCGGYITDLPMGTASTRTKCQPAKLKLPILADNCLQIKAIWMPDLRRETMRDLPNFVSSCKLYTFGSYREKQICSSPFHGVAETERSCG